MDQCPTLKTEQLHLSALVMSDADAVFAYASKPEVARFMTWARHESIDDAVSFLQNVSEAPSTQYDWGIRLAPSGDVVGALLFSFRTESEAEIHYTLDEPYWGRGLVTEACFGVLEWGFSGFPMLERVVSAAVTVNRGSTRVMEKLGMTPAGSYEEAWAKDGATHDMSVYEISRTTWEQQEPRRTRSADSTTERGTKS